ncbi:MAG: TonB-dependent receptor [Bacteroidales bacterium]|nr:TonB-dependent receptor [Bacteroidales bacterium]
MKKKFFISVFAFLSFLSFSQVITVRDNETLSPLEMVTIKCENTKIYTTTNSKGRADISSFKKAEKIEIRCLGYKTLVISYNDLKMKNFELLMLPSILTVDPVVISATKTSQLSTEVPSRIVSISAKTVKLQNPQTAADLLGISGKVFIQKSQQGGGSPMIRGFATNRLLYTIDGIRMNTAIFRAGNIQNVISLDPFATENTEVFFGPGSVIYGSDAVGGVMSFRTLTPQLSVDSLILVSGNAVLRYSTSNNEKTGHFDVNLGWKKWALVSSISSFEFGDLKMGSHGPDEYLRNVFVQRQDSIDVIVTNKDNRIQNPSGYSQINLMQKIRFRPSEKWDFQYGFHYSETSEYSRYDRHVRYKNGLPRYGEWNYGPQIWMMNLISVTSFSENSFYDELSIKAAQQFFEESRISRDLNNNTRETRLEKVDAYSLNLDLSKSINSKNELNYGAEIVSNIVKSIGIDTDISSGEEIAGPARYPNSTWGSYALFASDRYKFSEKIRLVSGLRYNFFSLNAKFDTAFYPFPFTEANLNKGSLTGSLGMVYKPTEKWVVNIGIASGFRTPNVDDLGKVFDSEPGSVTVPNPDLTSENVYNLDFGIAKVFSDWLKLDFTVYYTLLDNAMVRRDYTLNGLDSIVYAGEMSKVQAVQNAAKANVYGLQAGVEIKLPLGFGFSSDFNYQKGEEEMDDGTVSPSRHAPPTYGISRISFKKENLEMQFYAVYSDSKTFEELPEEEKGKDYIYAIDNDGNPWSPAWVTLNFKAMYKLSDQLTLSVGLENITDRRYRPYSSGIVAPGRNFLISLRAGF